MTEVKSYLDGIRGEIISELNNAKFSIVVASAYFTDFELANCLASKAKQGVLVDLIISKSEINNPSENIFENLRSHGVNVYKTGMADFRDGAIMHNKFCVIDYETVITGSYNWTRQAAKNEENIVVFKSKSEADQFLQKFYLLRKEGELFSLLDNEIEINLSLDKNIIEQGQEVKIHWAVSGAEKIEINRIGAVEQEGEGEVKITENTFIVIKAENISSRKRMSKSVLVRVARKPEITFDISTHNIIRTQIAKLSWHIKDAETIKIEPLIGEVESTGYKMVNPFESTTYTVTAVGLTETITKNVSLNVYPTPVLERLQIPTLTNLRVEASFVNLRVDLSSHSTLNPIEKFPFDVPRVKRLNLKLIPNRTTVEDVSVALKVPKNKLYASIGEVETKIKSLLFNGVERIFRKNPKMSEIIQTARKNYE